MLKRFLCALSGMLLMQGGALAQSCGSGLPYSFSSGTVADASQVNANFNYMVNCFATLGANTFTGAQTLPGNPTVNLHAATKQYVDANAGGGSVMSQGRLTLATGTPVMTSAQTGKTTIYYTPYVGSQVAITTNGTSFSSTAFSELSNLTTASSTGNAGPAAVVPSSNYDLFVWSNSGTLVLTRGPAWASDTGRGTGSTTTELQRVAGIWTNRYAITNGPGAGLGTYVGTVRSNPSSQIDFIFGGVGTGGSAAVLGVWNAYNRIAVKGLVGDNALNWTYTTATIRPANGMTTMRVSYVQGLQEDFFEAVYVIAGTNSGAAAQNAGIGYDSTTAFSGRTGYVQALSTAVYSPIAGSHAAQGLGFHYMQACEYSAASGTSTWYNVGGVGQYGLTYSGMF